MKFKWKIFVVAFLFSFVIGALPNVSQFLFQMFHSSLAEVFEWIMFALNVVSFFVSPLLLFASFYYMGRKIDLAAEFLSVVVSLFLGSWFGHLIGYFPLEFIRIFQNGGTFIGWTWGLWFLWYAFSKAFSLEFFAGFAALSMAYIVRKRSL